MAPPNSDAVRRRRDRLVGTLVVLLGVVVAALSVVALVDATNGQGSDVAGAVVLPSDSASPSTSGTSSGTNSSSGTSSSGTGGPSGSSGTSGSSSPSRSGSSSPASANRLPIVVLNNTSRTGLAQTAAATFTQGGWTVTSTSNFSGDILSTCAYYDPNTAGAQAAATALMQQFPAIKRTKEKFAGLPPGPVVVMLTTDYTAQ